MSEASSTFVAVQALYKPLNMPTTRPLNSALQQKAMTELNEDARNIAKEITSIREWIKEQPELGKYQISDQFILSFLRTCKYKHETVCKKLTNYLTMRTECPEIFAERKVDEDMMDILRTGIHLSLSMPMEADQSRIHISQYGKLDLKNYSVYQGIKLLFMMLEINLLEDDNTAVAGVTSIEDFSGITFGHMISMNIITLKRIFDFTRCGLPHRIKGIHVVNAPWFTSGILTICRTLLPAKIKSRFFIHSNLKDLHDYVPQKLLPAEYGGENETVEDITKVWEKKLQQYREYFIHDLQFGTGHEHEV